MFLYILSVDIGLSLNARYVYCTQTVNKLYIQNIRETKRKHMQQKIRKQKTKNKKKPATTKNMYNFKNKKENIGRNKIELF